ncbi:ABC transporter substrate-binding protein [Prosthecomicrobium sp. N25]|uniref:ABC transporter substrate-binding protein n=1 Tax=Prosthecomicrobium sp. N25 TaxID=3129254 RepID=UPI0030777EF9
MGVHTNFRIAALGAAAFAGLLAATAAPVRAQEVVFLSTQLRPIEEAQKVRGAILKGGPKTAYVTEEPAPFVVRARAEQQAGKVSASLYGAGHGEMAPLAGTLEPLDDVVAKLKDRGFPQGLVDAGKFGTGNVLMIPWMQASYVLVVNKQALPFLPAGANVEALTFDQLAQWGKAIQEKTGKRMLGFPAGPKGLMNRFLQGSLVPAYAASTVTEFRSAEAEKGWTDLKALWASVNPNSTSYDFMQEPLLAGDVWIAWDHVARVKEALTAAPNDYVVVPSPAGPKGRGAMVVLAGLSIPKGAPDRAGAVALIEHLTKPETQAITAAEVGFFPVVSAKLPGDLPPGVKLIADGLAKTQASKDLVNVLLPVGLGDKGGEFNKVYIDTFQRVVLKGEPVRAVLDSQAEALKAVIAASKAPCWAPDAASDGPCPVK